MQIILELTTVSVLVLTPTAFWEISTLSPLVHLYDTDNSNQLGISGKISHVKTAVFPISISRVLGVTIMSN